MLWRLWKRRRRKNDLSYFKQVFNQFVRFSSFIPLTDRPSIYVCAWLFCLFHRLVFKFHCYVDRLTKFIFSIIRFVRKRFHIIWNGFYVKLSLSRYYSINFDLWYAIYIVGCCRFASFLFQFIFKLDLFENDFLMFLFVCFFVALCRYTQLRSNKRDINIFNRKIVVWSSSTIIKMDDDQQFCLRWNNHQSTLISVFDTLLENGTLVDCTLAAEGKFLKAHKVVLCACSPYFAVSFNIWHSI